jgi:hypothetical protein
VNSTTYTSGQSVTGLSTGTVVISGLQPTTTYTFNLYTKNDVGNSPPLPITQATKIYLTNSGSIDTYIAKYDYSGTPQWAKGIGGTGGETPKVIISDSAGNVYVFGYFTSPTLTIGALTPLTNSGGEDTFIVKYNSSGVAQWAKNISGTGSDLPVNIVSDSEENLYVAGRFDSPTLTIDTFSLTRFGGSDTFIVKYNSSGVAQWVKSIGGNANDLPVNMVLGPTGYIYISGTYNAAINFM